jgi:MFS family permease
MISGSIAFVRQFEKNLWVLSFGWFVSALGFAISIPFIAIYFHSNLGISLSGIGLFFGAIAIVRSVFQAISGEVSDRMERRQLLIYSQLARAVTFGALALSIYNDWGFLPIAACLIVNSMLGAVFQPVANAMVADILPDAQRLDGYAITRAAGNLGWAAGPALGGFLAATSYSLLFVISAFITLASAIIFRVLLKASAVERTTERFQLRDVIAIKDDPYLAAHCALIFVLYLVVAQLMAPFSVYTVDIIGISETQLGALYTINGLMVVALQIPVTRMLARFKFTAQLAVSALIYAIGYGAVGTMATFEYFVLAMVVVTTGEMIMSPPSLALTSRLAPPGRMGRYMGIYGFFVASGWSFGPLYGGVILDHLGKQPVLAWIIISSLALPSALGYWIMNRKLPAKYNFKD